MPGNACADSLNSISQACTEGTLWIGPPAQHCTGLFRMYNQGSRFFHPQGMEWNSLWKTPLHLRPLCLHGIQTDIQREGLETGKWQPRSCLEGIFILPGFFFFSSSSAKFFIPWSKYISVKFFLLVCLTYPDRGFGNVVAAEVPVGGPWSCLSNKYSLSTECLEEMFLPLYSPL